MVQHLIRKPVNRVLDIGGPEDVVVLADADTGQLLGSKKERPEAAHLPLVCAGAVVHRPNFVLPALLVRWRRRRHFVDCNKRVGHLLVCQRRKQQHVDRARTGHHLLPNRRRGGRSLALPVAEADDRGLDRKDGLQVQEEHRLRLHHGIQLLELGKAVGIRWVVRRLEVDRPHKITGDGIAIVSEPHWRTKGPKHGFSLTFVEAGLFAGRPLHPGFWVKSTTASRLGLYPDPPQPPIPRPRHNCHRVSFNFATFAMSEVHEDMDQVHDVLKTLFNQDDPCSSDSGTLYHPDGAGSPSPSSSLGSETEHEAEPPSVKKPPPKKRAPKKPAAAPPTKPTPAPTPAPTVEPKQARKKGPARKPKANADKAKPAAQPAATPAAAPPATPVTAPPAAAEKPPTKQKSEPTERPAKRPRVEPSAAQTALERDNERLRATVALCETAVHGLEGLVKSVAETLRASRS